MNAIRGASERDSKSDGQHSSSEGGVTHGTGSMSNLAARKHRGLPLLLVQQRVRFAQVGRRHYLRLGQRLEELLDLITVGKPGIK